MPEAKHVLESLYMEGAETVFYNKMEYIGMKFGYEQSYRL